MKLLKLISVIIMLATMSGCGGKQSNDELIIIDVTKSYAFKDFFLQDICDVEYVVLESADEFLCIGAVQSVTKDYIIVRNAADRNAVLIFDRHTGKALHKISRQGGGPQEYLTPLNAIYDEDRNELFIHDHFSRVILVYDIEGNFKRRFSYRGNASYQYMYDYDRDHLFCSNWGRFDTREMPEPEFDIVSKQDGSIVSRIEMPIAEVPNLKTIDGAQTGPDRHISLFPSINQFIITDISIDTVYRYFPDLGLIPFIVRTPPFQSIDPPVFLLPQFITERYYFLRTEKLIPMYVKDPRSLPAKHLVYDTKEKAVTDYIMQIYPLKRKLN